MEWDDSLWSLMPVQFAIGNSYTVLDIALEILRID